MKDLMVTADQASIESRTALSRANRFEINLGAIAHNVSEVRRIAGEGAQFYAALKANAYGFGLIEVAKTVLAAGANALAVVDLQEAVSLRQHGVTAPILLYGGIRASPIVVATVEAYSLMPTVLDLDDARTYAQHATRDLPAFVKLDVGLERLGIAPEEAIAFVREVHQLPWLKLAGIYTHLHVPAEDEQEVAPYVAWQFGRFYTAIQEVERAGFQVPVQIAASSAVLRLSTSMTLNAIDPGSLLYGFIPGGPGSVSLRLRPAFQALKSRIIQVKSVNRSDFKERAPFLIRPGMRIGVLPIGIADGMLLLHAGQVLVRGQRAAILGISLEHTRIDLTDTVAQVDDEVIIIGSQGHQRIRIEDVVSYQQLKTDLAVALAVGPGIPRIYYGDGQPGTTQTMS